MLLVLGLMFEKATRLFVLVGLTTTKLSAWLPSVALTFTTASTQANGSNRLLITGARSLGFMHLRGSSGTSMRSWILPSEVVSGRDEPNAFWNCLLCLLL